MNGQLLQGIVLVMIVVLLLSKWLGYDEITNSSSVSQNSTYLQ